MKYTSLEIHRDSIVELMQNDVQLPVILRWLRERHGVELVLNTLRKFVVKRIGRDAYDDYLQRNGWSKPARAARRATQTTAPENVAPNSPDSKTKLGFDLNIKRPDKFNRTKRD